MDHLGLLMWTAHRLDLQPLICEQDVWTGAQRFMAYDVKGVTLSQHSACVDLGKRQS